jgi:hypothetical protein
MNLDSNNTSDNILQDIDNYVNLISVKLTEYKEKLETNYKMDLAKVNEKMEILDKEKNFYKNQTTNLSNDKKSLIKIRDDLVKQLEIYKHQLDDAKNKRKKKLRKTTISKKIIKRIESLNFQIENITKEIDDNNKKIKTLKSDEQIIQIKNINKKLMERRSELKKEIDLYDDIINSPSFGKKQCKIGYGMNPKTKRCVKLTGKIGKKLIAQGLIAVCKKDEIYNPSTNKCVKRSGRQGKKILARIGVKDNKNLLGDYYKTQQRILEEINERVKRVELTLDECRTINRNLNKDIINLKVEKQNIDLKYTEKNKQVAEQLLLN